MCPPAYSAGVRTSMTVRSSRRGLSCSTVRGVVMGWCPFGRERGGSGSGEERQRPEGQARRAAGVSSADEGGDQHERGDREQDDGERALKSAAGELPGEALAVPGAEDRGCREGGDHGPVQAVRGAEARGECG